MSRILMHYRRAEQVRTQIERASMSEEQRQIRRELAELERESSQRGFWFLRRREGTEGVEDKRNELREVTRRDSERAREFEEEAVGNLLAEVKKTVESVGREEDLAVVFDSAQPHILYISSDIGTVRDLTNRTIERLNSQ